MFGEEVGAAKCCRRRTNAHAAPAAATGQPRRARASAAVECLLFLRDDRTKTATQCQPHQKRHGSCKALLLPRDSYGWPAPPICKVGPRTFPGECGGLPLTTPPWQDAPAEVGGPTFFLPARSRKPWGTGIAGAAGRHEPCFPAQSTHRHLTVAPLVRYFAVFHAFPAAVSAGRFFSACTAVKRQRSFNWQSTAFVMRGLWVRFPPLAVLPASAGLRLPRFLS